MRKPSVKTLAPLFGDKAKEARQLFEANRKALMQNPAARARADGAFNTLPSYALRLEALNTLGGFHGVEACETERGEWAEYLNAGEMYAPTVIRWRGNYRVQSLGDFVETMERNGVNFK